MSLSITQKQSLVWQVSDRDAIMYWIVRRPVENIFAFMTQLFDFMNQLTQITSDVPHQFDKFVEVPWWIELDFVPPMRTLIAKCGDANKWAEENWGNSNTTMEYNSCIEQKNDYAFLIRVRFGQLLSEIKHFALVPPMRENGICGYKYKKLANKYNKGFNHSCYYLSLINPSHLDIGTRSQNARDKLAHGTMVQGSKCHLSKLTEEKVKTIKEQLLFKTNRELAEEYGLHKGTIAGIRNGKTWKHVE